MWNSIREHAKAFYPNKERKKNI